MDSIPKEKEEGVPHFTEDNLQRIIINPFYALTVAPQLTEAHEPPMDEARWVRANASLMGEMGAERWLGQLLDVLNGDARNGGGGRLRAAGRSVRVRCPGRSHLQRRRKKKPKKRRRT
jgi:hypothetical protein